jgi:hypothetical protein
LRLKPQVLRRIRPHEAQATVGAIHGECIVPGSGTVAICMPGAG